MRNPLYNDDFEHFLQKQVSQHRMYPSDQIWRNIQQEIHGYRRWPALTFTAITVITLLVAGTLLTKPETKLKTIEAYTLAHKNSTPQEKIQEHTETIEERVSTTRLTEKTIAAVKKKLNIAPAPQPEYIAAAYRPAINEANLKVVKAQDKDTDDKGTNLVKVDNLNAAPLAVKDNYNGSSKTLHFADLNLFTVKDESKNKISLHLPDASSIKQDYSASGKVKLPKPKRNTDRWSFQFYLTPSSSYRKLVDDKKARINSSYLPPNTSINYADANQVVRHRPAMGMEVGFAAGYSLNKRFTLKTGLQFNIRQYNIEAYNSSYQATTISAGENSFSTESSYRNLSGNTPVTLRNRNFEISVPVGIDYRVLGSGKVSWNIAAALQPTYIFDKEPFLLSADLKNYADGSSIMRKWNLNSSFETYLSIQAGEYRWQIGPQFRYQNLPTYNSNYPIKEHLLDFGLKVGLTRKLN
ncbi:outer membrane beta-barrel protein [Foetidibacter luteolus]|uniref:outer membrane beta-barrel protein n=1 Tax=Foetidibacter luteolus TaxID=2608880 RepID=UPI00129B48A3|nr:outer membrane beta-barrel protein [Foetidibacter luteolus]